MPSAARALRNAARLSPPETRWVVAHHVEVPALQVRPDRSFCGLMPGIFSSSDVSRRRCRRDARKRLDALHLRHQERTLEFGEPQVGSPQRIT